MISQPVSAAPRIALPWIIRLRYSMAVGQVTAVALVDKILHIDLPLRWIVVAPMLVVLSNVWLSLRGPTIERYGRNAESMLIGWLFVLDTLCLTVVLMLTGGATNPFSLFYLVHITLSAAILTQRQTWALGALSSLCFAALFWQYRPIPELEMHHRGEGISLHLTGMWIGFSIATLLVAVFSGKISELLREREESLLRMQEELARKDRLASLVTLAAGAAHELSTPLGTIAVVARDLERYAAITLRDPAVAEDSHLIRTEVDRCRAILQRLSIEGAEPAGEALQTVAGRDLLNGVRSAFSTEAALDLGNSPGQDDVVLNVPRHAVEQALIALVKNGLEASLAGTPVVLDISNSADTVRFEIRDRGAGMSTEALRHAGEPFFTTKEPGKGMGLGIFLVRTLAERLGGKLTLDSLPGAGTSAVLELPRCLKETKA